MKKERIFDTILHEAEEGGFWAECPSLKGCYAQGETIEEVKNNIQEAIELCLEELGKMKKRIPKQKRTYLIPVEVRF
jgi:predicted RNase H-like HicB family nuclease